MKRTFSTEEAQRIFAAAAERQQATLRDEGEHLTLSELEESAAAAGIDPEHVRAAAERLVRPSHTASKRRFLGLPVENRRSIALPFPLDDNTWGRIVEELRSVFGKRGLATEVGVLREWTSDAGEQRSPVMVTAEPDGNGTRLTIERSTWSQTLGLGGGTLSLFITAIMLSLTAAASGETDLWLVALFMTVIGLILTAALFAGTRIAANRDSKRFEEAFRRIRHVGSAPHVNEPQSATNQATDPPHQKPLLSIDDTPETTPLRQNSSTRHRER